MRSSSVNFAASARGVAPSRCSPIISTWPLRVHLRGQRHLGVRARAAGEQGLDHREVAGQDRRVQGGVAGAGGVRVGAPLEQGGHELAVPAVRRHHQGARPVGGGVVDVGPGVEEPARHRRVAVASREEQRRETADLRLLGVGAVAAPELAVAQLGLQPPADDEPARARTRRHVRASVDQELHDVGVAPGGRPHERRLLLERFAGVGVGAGVEEAPHRLGVTGAGAGHENGLAGLDRRAGVGAGREQQPDHAGVAVIAGEGERGHAEIVRGRRVGAGVGQPARRLEVVVVGGPVQRRRAVELGCVHVDAVRPHPPLRAGATIAGTCCRLTASISRRSGVWANAAATATASPATREEPEAESPLRSAGAARGFATYCPTDPPRRCAPCRHGVEVPVRSPSADPAPGRSRALAAAPCCRRCAPPAPPACRAATRGGWPAACGRARDRRRAARPPSRPDAPPSSTMGRL